MVTLFLACVVIAFFLCWAPFHLQRLMYVYGDRTDIVFRTINEFLYLIAGVAYYVSATINPILYNLLSVKYRTAFKETLCGTPRLSRDYSVRDTVFCNDGYSSRISFKPTNTSKVTR